MSGQRIGRFPGSEHAVGRVWAHRSCLFLRSTLATSSPTMATSSDGGDNYIPSTLSNTLSNGTSSGDVRFLLQSLLDDKEKQLQQAGTLGQQLLAQRMELDDTVRMLLEMLDAGDGDEVREKLGELEDTIKSWDTENEQLSIPLGIKVRSSVTSSSSCLTECFSSRRTARSLHPRSRYPAVIFQGQRKGLKRPQQERQLRNPHDEPKMQLIARTMSVSCVLTILRVVSRATHAVYHHRVRVGYWQRVAGGGSAVTGPIDGEGTGSSRHEGVQRRSGEDC